MDRYTPNYVCVTDFSVATSAPDVIDILFVNSDIKLKERIRSSRYAFILYVEFKGQHVTTNQIATTICSGQFYKQLKKPKKMNYLWSQLETASPASLRRTHKI